MPKIKNQIHSASKAKAVTDDHRQFDRTYNLARLLGGWWLCNTVLHHWVPRCSTFRWLGTCIQQCSANRESIQHSGSCSCYKVPTSSHCSQQCRLHSGCLQLYDSHSRRRYMLLHVSCLVTQPCKDHTAAVSFCTALWNILFFFLHTSLRVE